VSRKTDIDARLADDFADITVAGGYNTDAGQHVYWELEYTEHPEVIPSLALFRGEQVSGFGGDVPAGLGEENHQYPFHVEGFIEDDKLGTNGEKLRADIVRRLRQDPTLGGLAEEIQQISSSVAVQQGEEVFSCVQVSFTVFYVTLIGEI
jgi:hypothetical protein